MSENQTALEQLAEDALRADLQAKQAADKAKDLKDRLKAALDAEGRLNEDMKGIGNVRTVVKHVRRFDESMAKQALTDEEIEKYSVQKLDSNLLKQNYSPKIYSELFSKDYGWSLELKVAD